MCDRCSPSLFHAPDLNNSPCTDDPCTQDHLHGTAEPRNFRLCPSVCFCSTTAPSTPGAPLTRLYSAEEESRFSLHILSPGLNMFCDMGGPFLGEHCLDGQETYSRYSSHPSWGAQLQPASSGTSTSSLDVQESQCPRLVIELCGSTHSGGIICADSCSIRPETQASANTLPSLPTRLPSSFPTSVNPRSETQKTPAGRRWRG